ncbi:endonuclease/exonuclease/phosphatase family protein [Isosphaeraceae bacterium EP7]
MDWSRNRRRPRPAPGRGPRSRLERQLAGQLERGLRGLMARPEAQRWAPWIVAGLLVCLAIWVARQRADRPGPAAAMPAGGILVCTWNVENFFDDVDDPNSHDESEDWFASDPGAFADKVATLADALFELGDGRGPDVIAMVEVESLRSAEALRTELNTRLDPAWQYRGVVFRANHTGRRFAPAVITRLPVRDDLTRTFGIRRTLEAHLGTDDRPLTLLVSHWTSRVTDSVGTKRAAYADSLYRAFLQHYRTDPSVDLLIAGDFNDTPDDPSLRENLHTTADPAQARAGGISPRLLDLPALLDQERTGTYYYSGRWEFLDHFLASPGLFDDQGWSVVADSIRVADGPATRGARDGRPLRFGKEENKGRRGPSDHFALTVRLIPAGQAAEVASASR